MKKVVSIGLGMLLAIGLALPAAADENGSLASVFEELYSVITGWFEDDLDSQPLGSESNSSAPHEHANSSGGTSSGPGITTEMTPMTLPGG